MASNISFSTRRSAVYYCTYRIIWWLPNLLCPKSSRSHFRYESSDFTRVGNESFPNMSCLYFPPFPPFPKWVGEGKEEGDLTWQRLWSMRRSTACLNNFRVGGVGVQENQVHTINVHILEILNFNCHPKILKYKFHPIALWHRFTFSTKIRT